MGTRNLIAVVLNGTYVVAQYCQWDGYPSGQGAAVLDFLKTKMNRDLFVSRLKQCRWITEDEYNAILARVGSKDGMMDTNTAARFQEEAPQLSRDMGADILSFIQETSGEILLKDNVEFAFDSLFCEYAYVIDLDKNVLETYTGFNTQPAPAGARFVSEAKEDTDGYGPILLAHTYDLDELPTEKEFVNAFLDQEELEEQLVESTSQLLNNLTKYSDDADTAQLISDFMEYSMDEYLEYAAKKSHQVT